MCHKDSYNSIELLQFKNMITNFINFYNRETYNVTRNKLLVNIIAEYTNNYFSYFFILSDLYIKYKNEPGIDQGGITRMFYQDLSNEIINNIFEKINDKCNYYTFNKKFSDQFLKDISIAVENLKNQLEINQNNQPIEENEENDYTSDESILIMILVLIMI